MKRNNVIITCLVLVYMSQILVTVPQFIGDRYVFTTWQENGYHNNWVRKRYETKILQETIRTKVKFHLRMYI